MTPSERLNRIAIDLDIYGSEADQQMISDKAQAIAQIASEIENIDLEDHGDSVTTQQGLALARFLRRMKKTEHAYITLGGQGLEPEQYVLVQMSDGYTGGIDRSGRIST